MEINWRRLREIVRTGAYIYLALPVVIFFLGWCRWYLGIPATLTVIFSVALCKREYSKDSEESVSIEVPCTITIKQWIKITAIAALILLWTWLSGVGGYVWQNADHPIRNEVFIQLVQEDWPVVKELDQAAGQRGLIYYLAYWLPAAAIGKLFGAAAGWAMQYFWAVVGIALMYALVCICRKKLSIWPLILMIFFSGMDAAGMLLREPENFRLIGTLSLDEWFGYYQYSSMTTQLFWVFNQAVPAWVFCALVFLGEKPRNMLFLAALILLASTFPFAGVLPYVLYFMVVRSEWKEYGAHPGQIFKMCRNNWVSLQNVLGGGVTVAVCGLYLAGNDSVRGSLNRILTAGTGMLAAAVGIVLICVGLWAVLIMIQRGWGSRMKKTALLLYGAIVFFRIMTISTQLSPIRYWIYLMIFYVLEAGVLLAVLYPSIKDKTLFLLNAGWLYLIPLILIGKANDFCMRASIPGLFLMMLWCIQMLDAHKHKLCTGVLILLLAVGALTPIHEMARAIVNTRDGFVNQTAAEESIFMGSNFSGDTDGLFWKYIAKNTSAD
ncbi:MAG: hypothetical protein K2N87_05830 [Eubacterium sp.]|nr:hypothetical protein [Eubacterium sp.]